MKELYTRKMLDHDYTDEVANYIDNDMSKEEMLEDVRNILISEYDFEDAEILDDYLDNMCRAYDNTKGKKQ